MVVKVLRAMRVVRVVMVGDGGIGGTVVVIISAVRNQVRAAVEGCHERPKLLSLGTYSIA